MGMNQLGMDERLESVSKSVKAATDPLEPLLSQLPAPSGFGRMVKALR